MEWNAERRARPPGGGWRAVVRLRELTVLERDAPHGRERPLRLGLGDAEGRAGAGVRSSVRRARRPARERTGASGGGRRARTTSAARRRGGRGVDARSAARVHREPAGSRTAHAGSDDRMGVPGRTLRAPLCGGARRDRAPGQPSSTVPRAPCPARRSRQGTRTTTRRCSCRRGLGSASTRRDLQRRLRPSATPLVSHGAPRARQGRGLPAFGPQSRLALSEVTEIVESPDRTRVVHLDGPVARCPSDGLVDAARMAGEAACAWLARLQREDGSLPLRVRTSTGDGEGVDPTRTAMTAHALAEFGLAYDVPEALLTARRALASVAAAQAPAGAETVAALLLACYRGRAALGLSGRDGADPFVSEVEATLARSEDSHGGLPPLVGAHSLSFRPLRRRPPDGGRVVRVVGSSSPGASARLAERRAPRSRSGPSSPWLLPSAAESPRACAAGSSSGSSGRARSPTRPARPSRTAAGPGRCSKCSPRRATKGPAAEASARALAWLLDMQYRPDSTFFIPTEHRGRVMGGLRHDYYDTDAWIDAAGHLLLGLARLAGR